MYLGTEANLCVLLCLYACAYARVCARMCVRVGEEEAGGIRLCVCVLVRVSMCG